MRLSDSGKGSVKLIFALVFLGALAYFLVKVVPVYVHNYELSDNIRQLAIQATVDHSSAAAIQNRVLADAKELDLPVTRENVTVQVDGRVTISVDYVVPVDLQVYTLVLHFTPAADNKAI